MRVDVGADGVVQREAEEEEEEGGEEEVVVVEGVVASKEYFVVPRRARLSFHLFCIFFHDQLVVCREDAHITDADHTQ